MCHSILDVESILNGINIWTPALLQLRSAQVSVMAKQFKDQTFSLQNKSQITTPALTEILSECLVPYCGISNTTLLVLTTS